MASLLLLLLLSFELLSGGRLRPVACERASRSGARSFGWSVGQSVSRRSQEKKVHFLHHLTQSATIESD